MGTLKTDPRNAWIQMPSGKAVHPLDFKPDDFDINDVAHTLGFTPRFGGKTKTFYSVASHSIFVAEHLPEELKIYGLLHDAAEAYLQDIPSPLKKHYYLDDGSTTASFASFDLVESHILCAIAEKLKLNVQDFCDPLVKEVDLRALATEKEQLMSPPLREWDRLPYPAYQEQLREDRFRSKHEFLYMFNSLYKG